MTDIIHVFDHDWKPVSPDGDWILPPELAAHFGLVVESGQAARITDFCEDCDLFLARVYGANGQRVLGLTGNAYIAGIDLLGR